MQIIYKYIYIYIYKYMYIIYIHVYIYTLSFLSRLWLVGPASFDTNNEGQSSLQNRSHLQRSKATLSVNASDCLRPRKISRTGQCLHFRSKIYASTQRFRPLPYRRKAQTYDELLFPQTTYVKRYPQFQVYLVHSRAKQLLTTPKTTS